MPLRYLLYKPLSLAVFVASMGIFGKVRTSTFGLNRKTIGGKKHIRTISKQLLTK